jgi:hypothetical protein
MNSDGRNVEMDKKQIEKMLVLAEKERQEIDALISSLRLMLDGVTGPQDTGRNHKKRRLRRRSYPEAALTIKGCLDGAEHLLSPTEIAELLKTKGADFDTARIRNLLKRFKDELFESPKWGKWTSKGKSFESGKLF